MRNNIFGNKKERRCEVLMTLETDFNRGIEPGSTPPSGGDSSADEVIDLDLIDNNGPRPEPAPAPGSVGPDDGDSLG